MEQALGILQNRKGALEGAFKTCDEKLDDLVGSGDVGSDEWTRETEFLVDVRTRLKEVEYLMDSLRFTMRKS